MGIYNRENIKEFFFISKVHYQLQAYNYRDSGQYSNSLRRISIAKVIGRTAFTALDDDKYVGLYLLTHDDCDRVHIVMCKADMDKADKRPYKIEMITLKPNGENLTEVDSTLNITDSVEDNLLQLKVKVILPLPMTNLGESRYFYNPKEKRLDFKADSTLKGMVIEDSVMYCKDILGENPSVKIERSELPDFMSGELLSEATIEKMLVGHHIDKRTYQESPYCGRRNVHLLDMVKDGYTGIDCPYIKPEKFWEAEWNFSTLLNGEVLSAPNFAGTEGMSVEQMRELVAARIKDYWVPDNKLSDVIKLIRSDDERRARIAVGDKFKADQLYTAVAAMTPNSSGHLTISDKVIVPEPKKSVLGRLGSWIRNVICGDLSDRLFVVALTVTALLPIVNLEIADIEETSASTVTYLNEKVATMEERYNVAMEIVEAAKDTTNAALSTLRASARENYQPKTNLLAWQEIAALQAMLYSEAGNQSTQAMQTLAWTVVNRAEDSRIKKGRWGGSVVNVVSSVSQINGMGKYGFIDKLNLIKNGMRVNMIPDIANPKFKSIYHKGEGANWVRAGKVASDIMLGKLPRTTEANHFANLNGSAGIMTWMKAYRPVGISGNHILWADFGYDATGKFIRFNDRVYYRSEKHDFDKFGRPLKQGSIFNPNIKSN